MTLPPSFLKDGFVLPILKKNKKGHRTMMMGIEGLSDSGKTEFALSAPGPIQIVTLDNGHDGVVDKPKSKAPVWRCPVVGLKYIKVPPPGGADSSAELYKQTWDELGVAYRAALANPDSATVILDTDSDAWELQRLVAFGKLTKIPSIQYTDINSAKRLFIRRAYDSGKNVVFTYRVEKEYEDKEKTNNKGEKITVSSWTGDYRRQGFEQQDYLFQVQARAFYDRYAKNADGESAPEHGLRINKCKSDQTLIGSELRGDMCNFLTLALTIYPDTTPQDWGVPNDLWPNWLR